ncbi:MAG: hypothetical protein IT367_17395 [Candidatus Hydrogenedentes bacterium]|nr:hypothetical protein [Candidatus Hydrogenedentota bacterium]
MNEKEKQQLFEQISAYMDGESNAPHEVARLIETDADAARLYRELSRMSSSMQSLPAPDVHPAFATRVVAHVREHAAADVVPAWRFAVPKVLGGLAAVVAIAIAVWPFVRYGSGGITSPPATADPVVAKVLELRKQPEQSLAAQFDGLLTGPEADAWAPGNDMDNGLALVVNPTLSDDYRDVAGKVATLLGGDDGYDEDTDVFTALGSLNDSQAAVLREMLTEYVEGGSEIL